MSEWWTYDPAELLMFAPDSYWRLVARHNLVAWPVHAVAWAGGLLAWRLAAQGRAPAGALVLVAAAWLWVGWAFCWTRYAEIFLGAPALAVACWVQALALAAATALSRAGGAQSHLGTPADAAFHTPRRDRRAPRRAAGHALAGAGLLACPFVGLVVGRSPGQSEFFGAMPDPTALATVGVLLLLPLRGWVRAGLASLPLLVFAWGLGTHWAMAQ